MKKLAALTMATLLTAVSLLGCSSGGSKTTDDSAKPAATEEKKDADAAETSAADEKPTANAKLPITGIGTQISTEVKAAKEYKIACIVKNSTNPYMVGVLTESKRLQRTWDSKR